LAKKVMTLLEVPPGQQPTNITPTAIIGSSLNTRVRTYAMSGIKVNWAIKPTKTTLGRLITSTKSSVLSVVPMPNIIMPKIGTIILANEANNSGKMKPNTALNNAHIAKVFPIHCEALAIACKIKTPNLNNDNLLSYHENNLYTRQKNKKVC